MKWPAWVLGLVVLAAACTPSFGQRPALPTAIPGVSTLREDRGTPSAVPIQAQAMRGPTATPAPLATLLAPTPPATAPGIPHSLTGNSDCLYCHKTPVRFGIPPDHKKRSNATCLGCHALAARAPQPLPQFITHTTAGNERCLLCHLQGVNGAAPVPRNHAGRPDDSCRTCHLSR